MKVEFNIGKLKCSAEVDANIVDYSFSHEFGTMNLLGFEIV